MDVFGLREKLIGDHRRYVTSFIEIQDQRIRDRVETALDQGHLWPEPRIGLNPTFEPGGLIDDLVADGRLHTDCRDIFRVGEDDENPFGEPMRLHRHQNQNVMFRRYTGQEGGDERDEILQDPPDIILTNYVMPSSSSPVSATSSSSVRHGVSTSWCSMSARRIADATRPTSLFWSVAFGRRAKPTICAASERPPRSPQLGRWGNNNERWRESPASCSAPR